MIVVSRAICVFLGGFSGFSKSVKGVALFPFVFVRSKEYLVPWLITHERIHLRQQLELLIIGTIVLQIIEMLYAITILRMTWYEAYLVSSAEQEAYRNQNDLHYLKNRKLFAQFYYLFNKKKFTHKDGVITYL